MSDLRIATQAINISSLDQAKRDLANSLQTPSAKGRPSKIDKASHDFESILVGQWLEKAEKSFATVPGADPDQSQDSGHDQFQSIACQYLAQGLTNNGGFGIAAMISKHLTAVETTQNGGGQPAASRHSIEVDASKSKSGK
jgi:Rod binding domain-containing protein